MRMKVMPKPKERMPSTAISVLKPRRDNDLYGDSVAVNSRSSFARFSFGSLIIINIDCGWQKHSPPQRCAQSRQKQDAAAASSARPRLRRYSAVSARPIRSLRANSTGPSHTPCSSPSCFRPRRPMPASTRRRRASSRLPIRRRRWSNSARGVCSRQIRTIGLFRSKAANVMALSRRLIAEYGSKVPDDRTALESLPGVGRKTANVVLNIAFGEPTIAVDTHIFRVANRTGLAPGKTPLRGRGGPGAHHPGRGQAARPSLADPARPLCLQGAQARLPGLPHRRYLPLPRQDAELAAGSRQRRHRPADRQRDEIEKPSSSGWWTR